MIFQESEIKEREDNFYKNIISLYLKFGSVDEVFKATHFDLPISYPGMHHLIKRWGIVKSVGPNSKLSEALTFLTLLTESKLPLESLYKKLPPSFQGSLSTMHRIAHNAKEGIIRRYGTALVVTAREEKQNVLAGHDIPHSALTLPMTYSGRNEDPKVSILRVMQQEVFSHLAVEKYDLTSLIPQRPRPFMNLVIADIQVLVYEIILEEHFLKNNQFSSFKVENLRFVPSLGVLGLKKGVRPGVGDILTGYSQYLEGNLTNANKISNLNLALLRA